MFWEKVVSLKWVSLASLVEFNDRGLVKAFLNLNRKSED